MNFRDLGLGPSRWSWCDERNTPMLVTEHNDRVLAEGHWLTHPEEVDVPFAEPRAVEDPQDHRQAAQDHIAQALQLLFPDSVWDDSVIETARRVAGVWAEYCPRPEIDFKFTTFEAAPSQMVFVGDIEFSSLCAHHLMPFNGKAHVAYLPARIQAGLSKIPRLVAHLAGRPSVQEGLTADLLAELKRRLETRDVMVVVEAHHTCVSARGARLHNGVMRTALPSGLFLSSDSTRMEFYALLARNGV